jgi:hypothetical protein
VSFSGGRAESADMDKRQLLPKVVHPKLAKAGDYVFVWVSKSAPFVDIVQVREVTRNDCLRVEGRDQLYRRIDLLPPTKHRKQQYLEGLGLAACPAVGAFIPTVPLPKYPREAPTSPNVVGRPELALTTEEVSRSPSNYLDIRFSVHNRGAATVTLEDYEWEADGESDKDQTPFAYFENTRFKVFQVQGGGQLYPGRVLHYRVVVSNRAGPGAMRVFIPSGLLGGAIGTYTMFAFDAPKEKGVGTEWHLLSA